MRNKNFILIGLLLSVMTDEQKKNASIVQVGNSSKIGKCSFISGDPADDLETVKKMRSLGSGYKLMKSVKNDVVTISAEFTAEQVEQLKGYGLTAYNFFYGTNHTTGANSTIEQLKDTDKANEAKSEVVENVRDEAKKRLYYLELLESYARNTAKNKAKALTAKMHEKK